MQYFPLQQYSHRHNKVVYSIFFICFLFSLFFLVFLRLAYHLSYTLLDYLRHLHLQIWIGFGKRAGGGGWRRPGGRRRCSSTG